LRLTNLAGGRKEKNAHRPWKSGRRNQGRGVAQEKMELLGQGNPEKIIGLTRVRGTHTRRKVKKPKKDLETRLEKRKKNEDGQDIATRTLPRRGGFKRIQRPGVTRERRRKKKRKRAFQKKTETADVEAQKTLGKNPEIPKKLKESQEPKMSRFSEEKMRHLGNC